jgi:hypothetical protein
MAESLLNFWGQGRFQAYSAGSQPKGTVHPLALATLERAHLPVEGVRSKSWNEFAGEDAEKIFVALPLERAWERRCWSRPSSAPGSWACVSAAYRFTPSTSFANPAATLARSLGATAATLLFRWLAPAAPVVETGAVVPQAERTGALGPRGIRSPS